LLTKFTKEYLEEISFSNLVKAIDAKWGHTYIDPPLTLEDEIKAILDEFDPKLNSQHK
jgi:hypothetical protein